MCLVEDLQKRQRKEEVQPGVMDTFVARVNPFQLAPFRLRLTTGDKMTITLTAYTVNVKTDNLTKHVIKIYI